MMYKKSELSSITFKIILIAILSVLIGFSITDGNLPILIVSALIVILILINIIHQINKSNQKIAYFFNAVRNNDSSISFNEKSRDKSYSELHKSLNRVNRLIHNERAKAHANEQLYKNYLNHSASGLIIFDENGDVKEMNKAVKQMFSTFKVRNIRSLSELLVSLPETLMLMHAGSNETLSFLRDGELEKLLLRKSILKIEGSILHLVSVEDIKAELDKTELESWIKLIRVLTHEIMNTVTPITTLSGTLYSMYKPSIKTSDIDDEMLEDTARSLQLIHQHGEGLMEFVHTYRQLTQIPKPNFNNVMVLALLQKEMELFKQDPNNKNVNIQLKVVPSNLTIHADENLLSRVLSNLFINAIHAMKNGTTSILKVEAFKSTNSRTIIKIQDNGTGISEEVLDRIFIPFFTTKKEGSGIGLSLCKQIMHLHKGAISVESEESNGTVFILRF